MISRDRMGQAESKIIERNTMEAKYQELKKRLIEVDNLNSANALLYWDQSTYMPSGGAAARARQSATLSRLAHEQFTDPAIGRLLDDLRPYEESLGYDSDEASLIRVTRREFERAVRVPADFVAEMTSHQAESFQVWTSSPSGERFRQGSALPGEDAGPQPALCGVLPRLRTHRRPLDRRGRLRHEGIDNPGTVRRAAVEAGAHR